MVLMSIILGKFGGSFAVLETVLEILLVVNNLNETVTWNILRE